MTEDWQARDTSTHQGHVIAHVLGATALGYFVWDEAVYILLDIGFVWMILRDGEMGLLPHPVAVSELETNETIREQVKADIDSLLRNNREAQKLELMLPIPGCQIKDVSFFERGEERQLLIAGEDADLVIETSLETAEIQVYT
jgi:hypothetical protein